MENDFMLELIGALDKASSTKKINSDLKELQKSINMLRVTATLMKGDTKKSINQVIQQMEGQLRHVKLQTKIDQKNLKSDLDKALNGVSFKDIDAINIDENKAKLKAKKVIADVKKTVQNSPISLNVNIDLKKQKLDNQLTAYLSKHTKIKESQALLDEAEQLRDKIASINDKASLRDATDAFQLYKSETNALGYQSKSTSDKIKGMLGGVTKIGSAFGLASMAVSKFQESLTTIKNNNTITTEISKTSEMTKKQLEELSNESFDIASKYGKLSSNYLTSVQEASRAGYENAKSIAELSVKAQGAGDMTEEIADKYIIATDAAFKMNGSVELLTKTLDGANNITNNNSVNMTELAQDMTIVGSQAASSRMEVDETTAAIATMIAVTQRSGSEMANAFKGLLMNLQQVSGEVGDGEDIIDEESLTKYEKACAELGVSLKEVRNGVVSLKEPMQILKELAEAYTQLDEADARRANLLSSVGGKYRANALNAILENYDLYEKMLQEYSDGFGSMDEEAEKTANSLEGKLNALQNSWDSLVNSMTNKSLINGGISFFDGVLQSAERLVDVFDVFPVALAGLTAGMTALNKDVGINQIFNEDRKFDIQGNLFGVIDFTKMNHFKDAGKAIEKWNAELRTGQVDINDFGEDVVKNTVQLKEYLSTCSVDAPASLEGYKAHLEAAGEATKSLRLGTILLNTAISFGLGIAIQEITTTVIKGIDNFINSAKHAKEASDEFTQSINTLRQNTSENTSTVSQLNSEYLELSKEVNALGQNVGLSADEYSRYKEIISQVSDIMPELAVRYNEQGEKIGFVKGQLSDLNNEYKEYQKNQAKKLLTQGDEEGNKLKDVIDNYQNVKTKNTDAIKVLKEAIGMSKDELLNSDLLTYQSDILGKWDYDIKKMSDSEYNSYIEGLVSNLEARQAEMDVVLNSYRDSMNLLLQSSDEFYDLDSEYQSALSSIFSSIPDNIIEGYGLMEENKLRGFVRTVVSSLNDQNVSDALTKILEFDPSNATKKTLSGLDTYFNTISHAFGTIPEHTKQMFGFDGLELPGQDVVDTLVGSGISEAVAEEVVKGMEAGEVEAVNNYSKNIDWSKALDLSGAVEILDFIRNKIAGMTQSDGTTLSPSNKFQNLWDSENFADTREEIEKLAKQGKLTAEEINSLASENDDLSSILDKVGISSQFAARCFELVCNGADGFSNITESTLALDSALHEMDDMLLSATYAKEKYDEAMSKDDYNAEFKNYQEAYATAMESFKNGEYGKQFRASMEYLLGEDSYSMSIEELYKSVKKLGTVFGEEANNGLEFLDKLYAKKEILDGLDSTLKKTSDGGYEFDIKTDDFDNIAEALGMTTEEVTACINAIGMFGDYSSYDIEKVKDALDDMAISVSKTGKTTLSLQGLENTLSDLGYEGYEAYQILEKLRSQDDIKFLDFDISDGENTVKETSNIINKLKELEAIQIDYTGAVNTKSLVENMSAFGMSADQISEFLNKINALSSYHLDITNLSDLESIQGYVEEVLGNTDGSSTEAMKELADTEDMAKTKAEDLADALDDVNHSSMANVLSGIKNMFDALSKTKDEAETTEKILKNLFNTNISFPTVSSPDTSNNSSSSKKTSKKNTKATGTFAYADGTDVTLKRNQEAVVNELGNESMVRNGIWSEIPGGAHIENLKKGDIIFNHKQTEELKKNGRVASNGGRGKVIGAFPSGSVPGVNPATKKEWSSSSGSSSSSSSSSSSNATKEKTALEKFQEWISKLFDWIEIKIQRQSEKIDRYITKAENAKDSGKYGTSATNYRKAIHATTTQITYEQKAATKYNNQADKVVNKAVSMGLVTKKQADNIKKQVQDGSINIKKYSDKVQEVIKDYQTWYEKSKDASKAITELHNNIRTYIQDLKDMRDAQRDVKLSTIDTYTTIGTSGVANTKTTKNNQLKYTNAKLADQNSAYATETAKVSSDTAQLGKTGKTSITKALNTDDAKGKSQKSKAYKKALNNAKKAIHAKTAVSSADLKTIKSHSISVYNKLYAYNLALDNLETAKLEQATNYAATSSEIYQNIAEIYNNKDDDTNDKISLLQQQAANSTSAKTANGYLDKAASQYDTILKNDKAEIAEYESAVTSNTKKISNKTGTTANYKKLDTATKTKVKKAVDNAKTAAENGKAIAATTLSNLAKYYSQGYVTAAFYQSCVDYNNALESKEQAETQMEIDEQTVIQEKAAIGTDKLNNIEQEYTNKQNETQSAKSKESVMQSIKTTKGFLLDKSDYQAMLDYSKEEEKIYTDEITALNKVIQQNLDSGYWTNTSQEYIDKMNSIHEYEQQVLNCQQEQEEWNNKIAQFPYTIFEKANNLLQSMKSNFQSLLSIKTTRGVAKTDSDILAEMDYVNSEIEKQTEQKEQLWEDYQKALENDGAYGGKDADTWLQEWYEADTSVNNLKADIESLNNEIAQLPYETYEKALELLDSIASYNKSVADLTKAQGRDLSESDYLQQISNNNAKIEKYESERIQAYSDYMKALASYDGAYGGMTSDEWLGRYNDLGTTINGLKVDNEDIRDALRDDVYWRTFERSHKAAQALADVLSGITDLIDDTMLYDKDGKFTDFGVAQIANVIKQYETAREEVQNYTNDIQNLNKLYEEGYYNQDEFNEKLDELQDGLFESASSMKSYISEVIDMNKNLAQSELDNLFKLIDARNEALTAKKNYYDFDKTIKGKTKDIQSLEAKIAALEGIENAESKAQKAKLEADLATTKDDLNDTIINHSFELSQDALNELKDILQDEFDDRWDNLGQDLDEVQTLMASANELTAAQTSTIGNALNKLLSFYGIDPVTTDLDLFGNITGYASGTKSVDKDKVAWTQENGEEIIIRRADGAILTPFNRGDSVAPNDLSNNLFDWGRYNPQAFADSLAYQLPEIPDIPKVQGQQNSVNVQLGSMVNIEGNVIEEELPKLKNILDMAYKHTVKEIARDARKKGIKV